jgi:hypothetical protein
MISNVETSFPTFIAAYIDAHRTAVDLPAATVLPSVIGPTEGDNVYPKIFLVTEKSESPHPRRAELSVTIQIQSKMETTTLADEEAWCAALHRILSDGEAMRQYIAGLTTALTFDIRRYRLLGISTAIDAEKQLRARQIDVAAHLRTHETAPMA